jgi:hypothetical protein
MPEIKQAIITDVREVLKKDSSGKPIGVNHFLSITVLTDYQLWVSPEFVPPYVQHLGEKCFITVEEATRNGQKTLNLVNGGNPVFIPSVSVPVAQPTVQQSEPVDAETKPIVHSKSESNPNGTGFFNAKAAKS